MLNQVEAPSAEDNTIHQKGETGISLSYIMDIRAD